MSDTDIRDGFFQTVYDLARTDSDVVFITADADAFILQRFRDDMPDQFINAGVAEQNVVAMAAGLALSGKKVFIYAIIPFITLRCFEQIKVNICSMDLPVTIVGLGVGFSFPYDGPTHHAVCDVAIMRSLPELAIYNPADAATASVAAQKAYQSGRPSYVRLDKGVHPSLSLDAIGSDYSAGLARGGTDVCILSTGTMTHRALAVAEQLETRNIDAAVLDVFQLKPLDESLIAEVLSSRRNAVTLEEHTLTGGLGASVAELIVDMDHHVRLKRLGLPDVQTFRYGTRDWLLESYGLSVPTIARNIEEWLAPELHATCQ